MRFLLRTKLMALVVFSLVTLSAPLYLYSGRTLEKTSLLKETSSFRATCLILQEMLEERYLAEFNNEIDSVTDTRREMTLLADALSSSIRHASDTTAVMRSISAALSSMNLEAAFFSNGIFHGGTDMIAQAFTSARRDYKRRLMNSLLPSGNGKAGSTDFCVVNLEEDGELYPVLVCIRYTGADSALILASQISEGEKEKEFFTSKILSGLDERIRTLSLTTGATIALLSQDGGVILSAGADAEPKRLEPLVLRQRMEPSGAVEEIYTYNGREYFGRSVTFRPLNCHIVASIPMDAVRFPARKLRRNITFIFASVLLLGLILVYNIASGMTKPLEVLREKAEKLASLRFDGSEGTGFSKEFSKNLPTRGGDEVGALSTAFSNMAAALDENIARAIESVTARKMVEGELSAAREIQMGILPGTNAETEANGCRIVTYLRPAREVGGDFFDFLTLPDGRQAFVIGDVSGKGVSAALFMAMAVTLVRQSLRSGLSLEAAMDDANSNLAANNPQCMFVTLFTAVFDPVTGRLSYCSGGHNPPAVFSDSGVRYLRETGGPLVGVFDGAEYEASETVLEEGEFCLLYTDGVTEAMDEEGTLFGEERLTETLAACGPRNAVDDVVAAIEKHRGNAEQSDDITMLCFGRKPPEDRNADA